METAIRTSGSFVRTECGVMVECLKCGHVGFLGPKALSRAGGFRETSSLSPLAKSERACRSQGCAREGLLIGAGSREAAN
jgi:hypothetical protein